MKYLPLVFIVLLCSCTQSAVRTVDVLFAPPGPPVEQFVVKEIDRAYDSVLIEAYRLTSHDIIHALSRARNRSVKIRILIDRTSETAFNSEVPELQNNHLWTRIDDEGKIAHSKIMIIDAREVLTGSYNWTTDATKNVENLLIITDPSIVEKYTANWFERLKHAEKAD